MNVGYLGVGATLLAVAVVDILWTTIWVEGGAGPFTSRSMSYTWRFLRRVASRNSRLLTLSGPIILMLTLTTWILLLWIGWTFMFASVDGTIFDTVDGRPVSWSDYFYFTGYTVFTLGIGDFVPRGGLWQIATVVASASGLLFVTLAVTYVLSVLGAVTQKRAFAGGVSGLGTSSVEILEHSWDGNSFRGLELSLSSVGDQLDTLTSNHKAYPVLHYFYTAQPEQAPTTSVAVLDDALTLLTAGVAEEAQPSELILAETRASVGRYLETLSTAYVEPADRTPPPPEIADLREISIPTVSDEQFRTSVSNLDKRRRILLGLVESDEREWPGGSDRTNQ